MYKIPSLWRASLIAAAALLAGATALGCLSLEAQAADHGDGVTAPNGDPRPDARITDVYGWTQDGNLVIAVGLNPAIPNGSTSYEFPSDTDVKIYIDVDANVTSVPVWSEDSQRGGTVNDDNINADIIYKVSASPSDGAPQLKTDKGPQPTDVFLGLRDDPFLRTPRTGHDVFAIVIQLPVDQVVEDGNPLLIWAKSFTTGKVGDHAGLPVYSQAAGDNFDCLNHEQPKNHRKNCGLEPDVMILDTSVPPLKTPTNPDCSPGWTTDVDFYSYPNGRMPCDDVDQQVTTQNLFGRCVEQPENDTPGDCNFPDGTFCDHCNFNDRDFLADFPYLAPPHAVPSATVSAQQ
jgi:hypothetical protein